MTTVRTASCSCGQFTALVRSPPLRVSICHCLACQRRTGSVFGIQARFSRESVEVSGRSTQYVRVGDEGSKITFYFCPDCGATLYYAVEGYDDATFAIPVGAFADPTFPAPGFSVHEKRRHEWVGLPPNMEHAP